MWQISRNGDREFMGGKEYWSGAARMAAHCSSFTPDVEEEQVADTPLSCYNCRYRRWTADSFACQAPEFAL